MQPATLGCGFAALPFAFTPKATILESMMKTDKPPMDPELKRRIQELIDYRGGGFNQDNVADIIENALKLLKDVEDSGDVRVIQTAVRELRYAFKLFAPYAQRRKVTIFGSARTQPTRMEYQQALEFGRKIAQAGFMVITGAGGGIMHAGHEGAGIENSFGANIRLPWEQSANPVIREDKKLITFKYFFTRKLIFIRHSDAIALFPGGFGTMDEGYEAITLMQTGKSQLMPLVLIDRPGGTYWKTWDKHIREHLLRDQLISPDDLNLYQITDDTDQAVKIITRFYRNFHSTRFVKDLFVIRLKHAPSDSAIEAMNEDFADIVIGPKIARLEATPEEVADNDYVELPRIAFGFNRRDYGRLRQLIDLLNSL
ncbi:MAG TPA: LOG family protein [Bacillota bacterium]|nr:LOG family protein [Bacillota bacterium]